MEAQTFESRICRGLVVCTLAIWLFATAAPQAAIAQSTTVSSGNVVRISGQTGTDTPGCGSAAQPCKTLQYGVVQANSGDTVLVAEGVYTRTGMQPCSRTAVVCLARRTPDPNIPYVLTMLGGFTPDNWEVADPVNHPTIIDGEHRIRGVFIQGTVPNRNRPDMYAVMAGFTIRNAYDRGLSQGTLEDVTAFGAGLFADFAHLELHQMVFQGNRIEGGNTVAANLVGGAAAGAGVALRGSGMAGRPAILEDIVFVDNHSLGGNGNPRGGIGFGGGIYTNDAVVIGRNLTFTNNSATGGDSTGYGLSPDGEDAGSQGGAISVQIYSDVTLEDVVITGNVSTGGRAAVDAGGGGGGGILVEKADLTIRRTNISHNLAQGGAATGASGEGGLGAGGAIFAIDANLTMEQVFMLSNRALGGYGMAQRGAGGGGAGYITVSQPQVNTLHVVNSVIANNFIDMGTGGRHPGGGGGGLWLQGVNALLQHNTIAQNGLGDYLGGGALMVFGYNTPAATTVAFSANIIADHLEAAAVEVIGPASAVSSVNLFANNAQNTAGALQGMGSSILADNAGFVAPGQPVYDYHISFTSPAVDAAIGSQVIVDAGGVARVNTPDIGAWEVAPFRLRIYPVADGALAVEWGSNPGVRSYELLLDCPTGAGSPTNLSCGYPNSYPGTSTGTILSGLTENMTYGVWVTPILADGTRFTAVYVSGESASHFVYLPAVAR